MNAAGADPFAGPILKAELRLEQAKDKPEIEDIQALLALYAQAIEHY